MMKIKQISKIRSTGIKASLLTAGVWLATSTLSAFATDFTVNSFSDAVDKTPGDGTCEVTGSGGDCTLRAAIMEANAHPGADSISVPAGTYELTIKGVDEHCENLSIYPGGTACKNITDPITPDITSDASKGDLDITDDVTITGAGSDVTTIQWVPTSSGVPLEGDNDPLSGDRIFHVAVTLAATDDIASVVIQGLTIVNGEVGLKPTTAYDVCVADEVDTLPTATHYDDTKLNAYDIAVRDDTCGGLDADGKLSVGTSIIIDQFRRMGGGIAVGGGYSVVTYDSTKVGQPPAVITGGENQDASVQNASLNDVVVINNWSGGDGGGIFTVVPATISQSRISGNTSAGGNGGGLYIEGNTIISDTLIGKVFDADTAAAHPELTNRNYGENGGAIFNTGTPNNTLTILRSAINGNEGIGGAGIAAREAPVFLTNTTISGNTARDVGAGIITSGPVHLLNVTVADNLATTTAPTGGSGLDSFGDGTFTMSNTLLSNNKVEVELEPDKARLANCGCQGSDCSVLYVSEGYNLENGDTCNFDTTFKFDQNDTDPLLVALADNGGPTETHAITHSAVSGGIDSPAVDTGNNVNCPNNDQRGSIRPADGNGDGTKNCDIGAFELFEVTTDLQIANMVAPDTAKKGTNFTVTVTITNGSVNPDTSVELVTDALPSIVTFVSATATGGSVNNCAEVNGVATCTIGDLGGTSSATVTLTLTASAVGDATIAASVTSTAEPDASADQNNSASVLTKINTSGGGGGFCSYQPNGRFDPVLPLLLLIGLIYLVRKHRV
jgi:CSLREA domain-containing protein